MSQQTRTFLPQSSSTDFAPVPGLLVQRSRDFDRATTGITENFVESERASSRSQVAGQSLGHNFNRVSVHRRAAGGVQTKLTVNRAGDEYEQEADRVAEQVMRMPQPQTGGEKSSAPATPVTGSEVVQRACVECEEDEELQRQAYSGEPEGSQSLEGTNLGAGVAAKIEGVRRESGAQLPESERRYFEPRFGHDFSRVRVHTNESAAETARSVNARAYTLGRDIVFGAGQYAPGTSAGRRLLAHELTHVVQQSGGASATPALQRQDTGETSPAGTDAPTSTETPAAPPETTNTSPGTDEDVTELDSPGANQEEWIKDSNGSLYYKTQTEAEQRMRALQEKGEYSEYRVRSFKSGDKTFWRVEMRGPKKKPAAPETPPGPGDSPSGEQPPAAGEKKGEGTDANQPKPSKKVCLTFDDGPQDGTSEVLDVLDAKSAVATFFLTGKNMKSDPTRQAAIVTRMLQKHQVGNHTFTHDPQNLAGYKAKYGDLTDPAQLAAFQKNYADNEAHFKTLLGPLFPGFTMARLPGDGRIYKDSGGKLVLVVATEAMGMAHATWQFEYAPNGVFGHVTNNDWQGVTGVAATSPSLPGANVIILFHDRHWKAGNKSKFSNLMDKLVANNYTFGKLDSKGKCS